MNRFKYAAAAIALHAAPVYAQDIVVTAARADQDAREVGQAVTVLDRATIETRQTQSASDLLSTIPGITASRNGGPGQTTAVRIRGAEDSQTLVLIDGVRVNDPSSPAGAFDFGNLLIGNIERIEVLRGPNSVPWGSQAIGGVVNIVTAPVPDRFGGSLRAEYGYKDNRQVVGQAGGTFGIVKASLGGGYFEDDGISAFRDGAERDGYRQYAGNGRIGIAITDDIGLDFRGYYADSRVEFDGFPPPFFSFADTAQYAKTRQIFGYAGLNVAVFDGVLKNRIAYTISDIDRDSFDPAFGPRPSFIARGRVERFEYQGDATVTDGIRAVFGVEHENSRFRDQFEGFATRIDSAYLQAIVKPFHTVTVTGGARLDDHRDYGSEATFSANAAWRPADGTVIRASYGEGFKAPTLFQLNSFFGNIDLDPETARSFDLGIEQSLLDRALTVGVTLFHRDTHDQIDFTVSAARPFGFYDNIDRTRAQGLEAFVELRPAPGITIAANYSLIDAENRATGLPLLRRPKHSINLAVDWVARDWLKLGANIQTVSDSRDVDFVTFTPTTLDGHTLASIRAAIPLNERFEFFGRVENLFDEEYETVSGYGTLGRNVHIGVRARF